MPHKDCPSGYLSVTEVINLGFPKVSVSKSGSAYFYLEQWRGKVGNERANIITKESQQIGLEFHMQIEYGFNTGRWLAEGNTGRMITTFYNQFVQPFEVEPLKIEQTYQDKRLKLQGTLDAEAMTNKGEYVADWKTSNSWSRPVLGMQLAAYDYLRKGNRKGVGVRVDKEKDVVDIEWFEDLKPYWKLFKHCYEIAKVQKFGMKNG